MADSLRLVELRRQMPPNTDTIFADGQHVLYLETIADLVEQLIRQARLDHLALDSVGLFQAAQALTRDREDLPRVRVNFVPSLVSEASELVEGRHEELALMLLVTAVEHIVNEVLTYKMEETGLDDAGIEKGLWAKFPHKIGKLWTRHLGTPMDPDLQATIHAAVDRRNEFVHMRVDRRPVAYPEECALRMGVEDELLERLTAGVGKLQAIRRESVFRGFDREVFVMEISELLRRRQA